ncbi:RpiB/LacA/LacB family sugar-phosphate isomerase [Stecheria intestinalis]|uniref:RpiB/LacA/LacB family sugar-phosphate isomerase n=1 Tax=Stecheria intestinalis TaxID=2606630 RepID=UPI0023F4E459|nr:RpiB/LacA/LacB family sugar-phosphate isomerase [Stecheria intestinalis]MDD5881448.1 RpiB/LacA/LacB family sugar-phosphate isomerase [Stecheria intestinalis]
MHNNCQILCFGDRVIGIELAKMIIDEFMTTEFEGGRHERIVNEIMDIERRNREK